MCDRPTYGMGERAHPIAIVGGTVEGFRVDTARNGETLQIRLTGEFDLQVFERVDELLRGAQKDSEHDVVVDLRGVTSIDQSGIGALVSAALRAGEVGGHLRLIRGPDEVHKVFELEGLDSKLEFVEAEQP